MRNQGTFFFFKQRNSPLHCPECASFLFLRRLEPKQHDAEIFINSIVMNIKRIFSILFLFLLTAWSATLHLHAQAQPTEGQVTLEDIWAYYKYYPESADQFRWMKDDRYYSTLNKEDGLILQNSIMEAQEKQETPPILDYSSLDFGPKVSSQDIGEYSFNTDERKILLKAQKEAIYRYSSKEVCYVYDRDRKSLHPLHKGKKIGNATFSPDANKVAFTHDNNLYYQPLDEDSPRQITRDGKINEVINGSTDWVHEEELSFVKAFEWSPDSRYVSWFRFDESEVKEFQMAMYGALYPNQHRFKYPKAGESNAVVSIHIYDLKTGKATTADIGRETDQYIARMRWTPDGQLALMRLNRLTKPYRSPAGQSPKWLV